MTTASDAQVAALYRYPVKGFSEEYLASVQLDAGQCLPFDRAYAVENGGGRFDPDAARHLPKIHFLMLMRDERIATLRVRFQPEDTTLTILRDDKQVARGNLETRLGRQMLEQFLGAYFKTELRGPPRIVSAPGHSFSDVPHKWVHIVNLASVRDLERIAGRAIDPLRFRANVYVDGWPAWSELERIGGSVRCGQALLKFVARTGRCDATNVDPASAQRDMSVPALLERARGHTDFGVYAEVVEGGDVSVGDKIADRGPPATH